MKIRAVKKKPAQDNIPIVVKILFDKIVGFSERSWNCCKYNSLQYKHCLKVFEMNKVYVYSKFWTKFFINWS